MKVFGIDVNWRERALIEVRRKAAEYDILPEKVECHFDREGGIVNRRWVVKAVYSGSATHVVEGNGREFRAKEEAEYYARALKDDLQHGWVPSQMVQSIKDVGPLELYSRLTVGVEGAEVRCFNYGLGDQIPGTDRVATLADTNLPSKRRLMDESIAATDLSWHITLPTLPEHLVEVQKLMDRGSWELHVGGEKPFYQGLFCTTALSGMYVMRAYPVTLPQGLKMNQRSHPLTESALFYIEVKPPKIGIPIDVVFRIGCTRSRGVC